MNSDHWDIDPFDENPIGFQDECELTAGDEGGLQDGDLDSSFALGGFDAVSPGVSTLLDANVQFDTDSELTENITDNACLYEQAILEDCFDCIHDTINAVLYELSKQTVDLLNPAIAMDVVDEEGGVELITDFGKNEMLAQSKINYVADPVVAKLQQLK